MGQIAEIWVAIGAKLEGLEKGLSDAEKAMTTVGDKFQKVGGKFQAAGKSMAIAGAAMLAPIVGSVMAFAKFDAAMTESTAIMGDLSDAMRKKLVAAAEEVARVTTFSAAEAAKAYYFLASAGLSAEESMRALPAVAKFAQAGMFDLERATSMLADAQSALGLRIRDDAVANMENMSRVADVLSKANILSNATIEQFAESLTNRAGAALRLVGKEVEEGTAVLAAFASQGIKGAEAGTRLDIVLRDLQTRAIKNKEVFEAYGVAVYDSSGDMRNLADIIADLEKVLSGMSDEQKRATLMQMDFQDRSVSSILMLIGMSNEIRRYEVELRKAGGTTEEIAQKQLATFSAQMKLAKNNIEIAASSIGATLAPSLIKLTKNIQDIAGRIAEWINKHPELVGWITKLGAAVGAFLVVGGSTLIMFGTLARSIGSIISILPVLSGAFALLTGPIGIVVAAIAGLIAVGILVYKNWDEIKEKLTVIWTYIKAVAVAVWKTIWDAIGPIINIIVKGVTTAFTVLWDILKGIAVAIANVVIGPFNWLKDKAIAIFRAVAEFVIDKLIWLMEQIGKIPIIKKFVKNLEEGLAAAKASLAESAAKMNESSGKMGEGVEAAAGKVDKLEKSSETLDGTLKGIPETVKSVTEKLSDLADKTEVAHPAIAKLERAFWEAANSGRILKSDLKPIAERLIELKQQAGEKVPTSLYILAGALGDTIVPLDKLSTASAKFRMALYDAGMPAAGLGITLGETLVPAASKFTQAALIASGTTAGFGEAAEVLGVTLKTRLKEGFDLAVRSYMELSSSGQLTEETSKKAIDAIIAKAEELGIKFKDLPEPIRKAANKISTDWKGVAISIGQSFSRAFEDILSKTKKFGDIFKSIMQGVVNAVATVLGAQFSKVITKIFDGLSKKVGDLSASIVIAFGTYVGVGLMEHLGKQLKIIGEEVDAVIQEILDKAKRAGEEIAKAISPSSLRKGGGVTPKGTIAGDEFSKSVSELNRAFDNLVKAGLKSGPALDEAWGNLISSAKKLGLEGSRAFIDLILKMREAGMESRVLTDYIQEQLGRIPRALTSLVKAGGDVKSQSLLALHSFNSMLASGVSWIDALSQMKEPLAALRDKYKELGIAADASIQRLFEIVGITEANQGLFDSVQANKEILEALGNSGWLTAKALGAINDNAKSYFEQLKATGMTAEEAIRAMAPTLQQIYNYAKAYGLALDPATQDLVDQAKAAGLVKDQVDAQAQATKDLTAAMTGVSDVIKDLIDLLKKDMKDATDGIADSIAEWSKNAKEAGDDIEEAGGKARGFNVGESEVEHYQHGGIAYEPTLARISEVEPEVVMPLRLFGKQSAVPGRGTPTVNEIHFHINALDGASVLEITKNKIAPILLKLNRVGHFTPEMG